MVRYNSDGSLDTSFDTDGIATTAIGTNSDDAGRAVAVQSDGKIIVAGTSDRDFAVVRYNSDGSLDTSFDTDGIATTAISTNGPDSGRAVAVQSDGKIIVAGTSDFAFAVVRYNGNGSLDTSFDTDGIATTAIGTNSDDSGRAVAVQSDGKIIVAGTSDFAFAVVRYNSDGSLDTTFDTDGKTTVDPNLNSDSGYDGAFGVAVQADGKIVVAGVDGEQFVVVRLNSDGSLDTTFDTDGIATTEIAGDVPVQNQDGSGALVLQSDGKIIVAGTVVPARRALPLRGCSLQQ